MGGQSPGSAAFSAAVAHLPSPGSNWRQALSLPCLLCPWPQGPSALQLLRPAQPAVIGHKRASSSSPTSAGQSTCLGEAGPSSEARQAAAAGSVVCSEASYGQEWALSRWPPWLSQHSLRGPGWQPGQQTVREMPGANSTKGSDRYGAGVRCTPASILSTTSHQHLCRRKHRPRGCRPTPPPSRARELKGTAAVLRKTSKKRAPCSALALPLCLILKAIRGRIGFLST